jgi:hypothetical protein
MTPTLRLLTVAALGGVFAVSAAARADDDPGKKKAVLIPMGMGSNSIPACAAGDKTEKLSHVVRLHIPAKLFSKLGADAPVSCPYMDADQQPTCTALGVLNGAGTDDDPGIGETFQPQKRLNPPSPVNWPTPLDVDLQGYWVGIAGKAGPILLKIILDDPSLQFFHPQGAPNWREAVTASDESGNMFYCLEDQAMENGRSTIKLHVRQSANFRFGGLNIGILAPVVVNPAPNIPFYLPLYIDPQFHNNG